MTVLPLRPLPQLPGHTSWRAHALVLVILLTAGGAMHLLDQQPLPRCSADVST